MSGDENKLKKYRFPETLTNQSRWFGLRKAEDNKHRHKYKGDGHYTTGT